MLILVSTGAWCTATDRRGFGGWGGASFRPIPAATFGLQAIVLEIIGFLADAQSKPIFSDSNILIPLATIFVASHALSHWTGSRDANFGYPVSRLFSLKYCCPTTILNTVLIPIHVLGSTAAQSNRRPHLNTHHGVWIAKNP